MRKWLIAGVAVLVVAGAALLAVANLDRWLQSNREWVGERVSSALGREVRFAGVGVSLWGGLGVRVDDLRVGDDPAFSEEDFVRAETVDVRVAFWPALFGDIRVGRVVLRSPTITVIQGPGGLSVDSLGGGAEAAEPEVSGEPGDAGRALAVSIATVDVRDGTVRFVDRTARPPVEWTLEQLDFRASDVKRDAPVSFEISAAALGARQRNLEASGTLGPLGAARADTRVDLHVELDPLPVGPALALPPVAERVPPDLEASGTLRLEGEATGTLQALEWHAEVDAREAALRYGARYDKAAGAPLRLELRGTLAGDALEVSPSELVMGESSIRLEAKVTSLEARQVEFAARSDALALADLGLASPEAEAREELRDLAIDGTLALPAAGPDLRATLTSAAGMARNVPYRDLDLALRFREQRATIDKLAAQLFEGRAHVDGYYDLGGPGEPFFDLRSKLDDVKLGALVASRSPATARMVQGQLATDLAAKGRGSSWDDIKRVMTGGGNLQLDEGVLRDVNLAESAMRALTGVPGLTNLISPAVRKEYPEVFGVGDTVFERLDAQLEIRDGTVHARNLRLAARDYELRGEGRYSLDNALDLAAVLILSEPLSADLVDAVKEARYLRGEGGRIQIPVRLRGGLPDVRPQPDLGYVASALRRQVVGGLLDRALGRSGQGEAREPEGERRTDEPAPPADAAEELLRRGLDSLFDRR